MDMIIEQAGVEPQPHPMASGFRRSREWMMFLQKTRGGDENSPPVSNLSNAITVFRQAPQFEDVFAWNSFSLAVELTKRPPWLGDHQEFEPHDMQDYEFPLAQAWLQSSAGLKSLSAAATRDAIVTVAHDRSHHPVREYLLGLSWDGIPRIDTWLMDYMGVEDTPLNRAFGARFLMGGVARVFDPGCKLDTVLILEGDQDIGKSTALRGLAGEWFSDDMPADLGNKDAGIALQGQWIIELAEMHPVRKTEVDALKGFLSRQVDNFRPPYAIRNAKFPRQCIFAGTTNNCTYLHDETGDRRFWTVLCGVGWDQGRTVDLKALRVVRDALWAEAKERYERGEKWWLDTYELRQSQQAAADERFDHDVWTGKVLEFISSKASVTMDEVLASCLGVATKDQTRAHQTRVGTIIRKAGWRHPQSRVKGARIRRYVNPNPPAPKTENVVPLRTADAPPAGRPGGKLADLLDT